MIKEIKFTDNALKQIQNLLSKKDDGSFFRIAIKGGGCSGFQYEFTFEQSKNEDDLTFQNILIDKTSAQKLFTEI
jgi:iron-sulfur cluster insertion protein